VTFYFTKTQNCEFTSPNSDSELCDIKSQLSVIKSELPDINSQLRIIVTVARYKKVSLFSSELDFITCICEFISHNSEKISQISEI